MRAGLMRRATPLAALLLAGCAAWPGQAPERAELPLTPGTPALVAQSGPRQAVLTLHQRQGERRLWRGAGKLALSTEGARITGTAGFGQLYTLVRTEGADPLGDPRSLLEREVALRRLFDLAGEGREPDTMRFGLSVECRLRGRPAGLNILVEERCLGTGLDFTNRFWLDAETGALRRADQWVGDQVPPVTIEPAGSPADPPPRPAS